MFKYIIKRLLYVIPVMLGVLIIVFALKTVMPGDPIDMILPAEASEVEREAKREELGLNDPIVVQCCRGFRLPLSTPWARCW